MADMDTKQRRTVMIRAGAAGFILLLIIFFVWFMFFSGKKPEQHVQQLGPSDQMAPKALDVAKASTTGVLTVAPGAVQFQQDQPNTQILILKANNGAVTIADVVMPTADGDALKVQNMDCPQAPVQLPSGAECHAQVTWNGTRTINTTIQIDTTTIATGTDAQKSLQNQNKIVVPVSGVSTKPAQPGQGGQGGQGAQGGVNGLPSQQGGSVPPPGSTAGNGSQAASGASPMETMRSSYLNGRRGGAVQIAQGPTSLQAAATSPYQSWDNVGITGRSSSFPVEMTHVITPDKPLPAVLTLPIDTRQTVTAVAMIDRDVYGENGRTVILPRGTKLIGKIGGGATDRVGIAWSQIIRPDGVRFSFQGDSADAMGRGGVPGRINNRYLQRYGFSLIPNAVGAGVTAALGGQSSASAGSFGSTQTIDSKALASQILQQPLNQISQDLYQKNRNIPVQITVPAGTRITVWSTDDLRLKPVGEPEKDPSGRDPGQSQGQKSLFPTGGSRPNLSPPPQQSGQTAQAQPQASQNGSGNGNGSLQVGQIDSRGNYVSGSTTSSPSPGAFVTPGDNPPSGVRAPTGGQTGTSTTNGTTTTSTTFQPQTSPWK